MSTTNSHKHENSKQNCRVNDLDVEIRALHALAACLSSNVRDKTFAIEPKAAQPFVEDHRSITDLHSNVTKNSKPI